MYTLRGYKLCATFSAQGDIPVEQQEVDIPEVGDEHVLAGVCGARGWIGQEWERCVRAPRRHGVNSARERRFVALLFAQHDCWINLHCTSRRHDTGDERNDCKQHCDAAQNERIEGSNSINLVLNN
jgi:hypothetical protein